MGRVNQHRVNEERPEKNVWACVCMCTCMNAGLQSDRRLVSPPQARDASVRLTAVRNDPVRSDVRVVILWVSLGGPWLAFSVD